MFLYHQDTIDIYRLLISESDQFPDLANNVFEGGKGPFISPLIEQKRVSGELSIEEPARSAFYFIGVLKEYHFWPIQ